MEPGDRRCVGGPYAFSARLARSAAPPARADARGAALCPRRVRGHREGQGHLAAGSADGGQASAGRLRGAVRRGKHRAQPAGRSLPTPARTSCVTRAGRSTVSGRRRPTCTTDRSPTSTRSSCRRNGAWPRSRSAASCRTPKRSASKPATVPSPSTPRNPATRTPAPTAPTTARPAHRRATLAAVEYMKTLRGPVGRKRGAYRPEWSLVGYASLSHPTVSVEVRAEA